MKTNSKLKKLLSYKANQDNLRIKAIKSGVNLIAPETIFLSKDTKFGRNVTINPYVVIGKKVRIGNNVKILSFTHIEGAKIENKVTVGPYARIRSGTHLMSGVKIGNFVETKKSKIKSNYKVSHISYIGDEEIGKNTNIGAGTITCNYDGINKNKTIISDNVFIGSNSSLVAPVKIKKKSTIGAGSVITKDVKENSLALERSEQEEIENYKRK
jgi:UDP-N-acetylglucosamine diphosphorylase/glucosamine-1-phosphate N-acetyltransferase